MPPTDLRARLSDRGGVPTDTVAVHAAGFVRAVRGRRPRRAVVSSGAGTVRVLPAHGADPAVGVPGELLEAR